MFIKIDRIIINLDHVADFEVKDDAVRIEYAPSPHTSDNSRVVFKEKYPEEHRSLLMWIEAGMPREIDTYLMLDLNKWAARRNLPTKQID